MSKHRIAYLKQKKITSQTPYINEIPNEKINIWEQE
jgi:hypothetical protein